MVFGFLNNFFWATPSASSEVPNNATLDTMAGVLRTETLQLVEWLEQARDAIQWGNFEAADDILTKAAAQFRNWPFYKVSPNNPQWLSSEALFDALRD